MLKAVGRTGDSRDCTNGTGTGERKVGSCTHTRTNCKISVRTNGDAGGSCWIDPGPKIQNTHGISAFSHTAGTVNSDCIDISTRRDRRRGVYDGLCITNVC